MNPSNALECITLGVLAGGRATRLEGRDKAWTVYRGQSLIERCLHALGKGFAASLVSANRDQGRYEFMGIRAIADRMPGFPGPLAGIDALLAACETRWLLTVPIDLRAIPRDLVQRLCAAGDGGAVAYDSSGIQPLIALWPVARARDAVAQAFARGEFAVHQVTSALALPVVHFDGADFGNLNTQDDFLK